MSLKSEVLAILAAKKEEKLAAVSLEFDVLSGMVQDLPEDGPADVVLLQQQLDEAVSAKDALQGTLDSVNAAFQADEIEDNQVIGDLQVANERLQAKLEAIRAALEA